MLVLSSNHAVQNEWETCDYAEVSCAIYSFNSIFGNMGCIVFYFLRNVV